MSSRFPEIPTHFGKIQHNEFPKISVVVGISGRTFEFPIERSKSGKTFKFRKTGHPKISVVVGISGRTFEFPVERSNFRSNVQNSKKRVIRKFRWYFEFPVERSNFRSNVRISDRTFEFPVERSNFRSNVQNSKKRVIRKFRPHLPKSYKTISNHIKTI